MKKIADKVPKSTYKREIKHGEREEPILMNADLKKIKERKRLSRNRRNAQCGEEDRWRKLYAKQKIKVQTQIRKEISRQEERIT